MWMNLKSLWDSVGDVDESAEGAELSIVRHGSRYYGLINENNTGSAISTPSCSRSDCLSTRETAAHAGSTLAASLSTSVVTFVPSVLLGTQSLYTTIVPLGSQSVMPVYALQNGQMIVSHYSIFTASSPISGWFPHHIMAVSVWSIPVFSSMFAIATSLDSIHSYFHNHCSLKSALTNCATGAVSGGAIGIVYYGLVSSVGMVHAPVISAALCVGWLMVLYWTRNVSSTEVVIGSVANLAGISTFLMTFNPILSICAALAGSYIGSAAHLWVSSKWRDYLQSRLVETSLEILSIERTATRFEIESAYRKLAREHHPDKNGSREMFELIHIAKDILLFDLRRVKTTKRTEFFWYTIYNAMASIIPSEDQTRIELPTDYLDTPD